MRKYIFLDIDGTLFSPKTGSVPSSAIEAIHDARKNGHKVFLCTGRSLAEVSKYLNEEADGFVLAAGSMVYCEGKRIFDHPIAAGDIARIKKLILSMGLGYGLEGSAGAYYSKTGYEFILQYLGGGETDRKKLEDIAAENCSYPEKFGNEESDNIYKVCAYGSQWNPKYPEMEKKLEKPFILTKAMELKQPQLVIGEITNGNITKADGIHKILDYYAAETFDAVGIGDSANDIPMLKTCGMGIAMGNATDETKAAADYVTTDILADGIKNAFKHVGVIE